MKSIRVRYGELGIKKQVKLVSFTCFFIDDINFISQEPH
jgi:hypothetical protein